MQDHSSVRSANTAKLARDLKDNILELAKANLDNVSLAQIAVDCSVLVISKKVLVIFYTLWDADCHEICCLMSLWTRDI